MLHFCKLIQASMSFLGGDLRRQYLPLCSLNQTLVSYCRESCSGLAYENTLLSCTPYVLYTTNSTRLALALLDYLRISGLTRRGMLVGRWKGKGWLSWWYLCWERYKIHISIISDVIAYYRQMLTFIQSLSCSLSLCARLRQVVFAYVLHEEIVLCSFL